MSTILNTNGDSLQIPEPLSKDFRVAIVCATWNSHITHALRKGAVRTLHHAGIRDEAIDSYDVPGTVELAYAAGRLAEKGGVDAVIVIGCVIRGDTPHFDYVCQIASQAVAEVNARGELPVIFGVLTVDNEQQALDRAGGSLGNKGSEAACAAIDMANFRFRTKPI